MFSKRFTLSLFAFLAMSSAAFSDTISKFDGIYKGGMKLYNQTTEIPLAFSLTFTGEYIQIPKGNGVFEQQQVIDSTFLIDDEGGPYQFWRVSYNLEKSQIDLRYNRPNQNTNSDQIPSSFRLIGKTLANGVISGKVISGANGPIGTFKVTHSDDEMLSPQVKYAGVWDGVITLLPERRKEQLQIRVQPGDLAVTNPANLEFDFSPGKIGGFTFETIPMEINKVVMDYLHRKMFLIQAGPDSTVPASSIGNSMLTSVNLACDLGPATAAKDTNELTGILYSTLRGKRGTFTLTRTGR